MSLIKITMIAVVLTSSTCKKPKSTPPAPPVVVDCIIADKSKLENIAIFPVSNPLNQDISALAVDTRSAAIISLIGTPGIHSDFGSGLYNGTPIGIPFILICSTQVKNQIVFRANSYDGNYGTESDPGPYPIPLTAPIEAGGTGGDSHVIGVDVDNKILYELYNARVGTGANVGKWEASSGAVWDLKTNATRPAGWTSADAAGLPILPCLVRYDEVANGVVDHAIRFTLSKAKLTNGYTAPASHKVSGTNNNANAPTPMGMRMRLKASFDISGFSPTNKIILAAMKKYGIILADIGSDFYIGGAPDSRWDNNDLSQLKNVKANDFEVVQMGTIVQ